MFDDDLMEVFFHPDDFAVHAWRVRTGQADVAFAGHLSEADAELFQGHGAVQQYTLHYATAAVQLLQADKLRTQRSAADGTLQPPRWWTVLRTPERVNEGSESLAYLHPAAAPAPPAPPPPAPPAPPPDPEPDPEPDPT